MPQLNSYAKKYFFQFVSLIFQTLNCRAKIAIIEKLNKRDISGQFGKTVNDNE